MNININFKKMNNIPPKLSDLRQQQKLNTPPKLEELRKLKNVGIFLKYFLILSIVALFCVMIFCALSLWSNYNSVYCDNCYAFHGSYSAHGEFTFKNNNGKTCDNCDNKMKSIFFKKDVMMAKICSHCNIVVHNKNDLREETAVVDITLERSRVVTTYIHKKCNTVVHGGEQQVFPILALPISFILEIILIYLLLRFLKVQRLKKLSNAVNK